VLGLIGRWQEAEDQFREAIRLAEEAGDRLSVAGCQSEIAELFRKQGQYIHASDYLKQAQPTFESLGYSAGVGQVLHYAGTLAAQQGQRQRKPATCMRAAWRYGGRLGDRPQIGNLLNNLGILARQQGDSETSSPKYIKEALDLRRELGDEGRFLSRSATWATSPWTSRSMRWPGPGWRRRWR